MVSAHPLLKIRRQVPFTETCILQYQNLLYSFLYNARVHWSWEIKPKFQFDNIFVYESYNNKQQACININLYFTLFFQKKKLKKFKVWQNLRGDSTEPLLSLCIWAEVQKLIFSCLCNLYQLVKKSLKKIQFSSW